MSHQQDGKLEHQFTFSRFPISATNQAVVETCRIVATHPGLAYNPLFLYGKADTSKTHLLHAIGNQIRADNPRRMIVYLSCKQLMMQRNTVAPVLGFQETRSRYQKIDVLLLDELEQLAGSSALQHELLYLITLLHRAGKQIVIAADRAPQALVVLIERVRARAALRA
jgi:chromosomal replication initiator protein